MVTGYGYGSTWNVRLHGVFPPHVCLCGSSIWDDTHVGVDTHMARIFYFVRTSWWQGYRLLRMDSLLSGSSPQRSAAANPFGIYPCLFLHVCSCMQSSIGSSQWSAQNLPHWNVERWKFLKYTHNFLQTLTCACFSSNALCLTCPIYTNCQIS